MTIIHPSHTMSQGGTTCIRCAAGAVKGIDLEKPCAGTLFTRPREPATPKPPPKPPELKTAPATSRLPSAPTGVHELASTATYQPHNPWAPTGGRKQTDFFKPTKPPKAAPRNFTDDAALRLLDRALTVTLNIIGPEASAQQALKVLQIELERELKRKGKTDDR